MLITNLNSLFGQTPTLALERQEHTTPVDTIGKTCAPKVSGGKYDNDIIALSSRWADLLTGICIETTLQDMLTICPRHRPRIEAYKGLVGYLKDHYGTTLIIKSRKTK